MNGNMKHDAHFAKPGEKLYGRGGKMYVLLLIKSIYFSVQ
jgi:hypothetical protein